MTWRFCVTREGLELFVIWPLYSWWVWDTNPKNGESSIGSDLGRQFATRSSGVRFQSEIQNFFFVPRSCNVAQCTFYLVSIVGSLGLRGSVRFVVDWAMQRMRQLKGMRNTDMARAGSESLWYVHQIAPANFSSSRQRSSYRYKNSLLCRPRVICECFCLMDWKG